MTNAWALSALWVGLALVAPLLAMGFWGLNWPPEDRSRRADHRQASVRCRPTNIRIGFFPARISHHIRSAGQDTTQLRIGAVSCCSSSAK